MAIHFGESWKGAFEAVRRRFSSRGARGIFESTSTDAPLRIAPAVAVVAPPPGEPLTRPPSQWLLTAWRYFILNGDTVVAAADVEEIEGRIDVASVMTGQVPANQVEMLVRVEGETAGEDARVCFAIVPWLFFVSIAVMTDKQERIFVIDPGGAALERRMYDWPDVRNALRDFHETRVAAARRRDDDFLY